MNTSIFPLLGRLWAHLDRKRHKQFALLLLLMLLSSLAETLSIGSVLPFLAALTSPERIFSMAIFKPIIQILGLTEPNQLLLPLTLIFCFTVLVAGGMRIALLWATTRLSFSAGADVGMSIYSRTLYQPYIVHCHRNSSEIINGISGKANAVIYSVLLPVLALISSSIMLAVILFAFMIIQPIVTMAIFIGFAFLYWVIISLARRQISSASSCVARESTAVIKNLQEGLGGIRDILLDSCQKLYCDVYRRSDSLLRKAQSKIVFISASPRYIVEVLGMILIASVAYFLAIRSEGITQAIPILGMLALGAQRLLPVLQQAYGAFSQIKGGQESLRDAIALLDQPLPKQISQIKTIPLPFNSKIELRDISFYYEKNAYVLNRINLLISKGERVGFIGATGSGKSTLIDIIMGLLEPVSGVLEVDGQVVSVENNSRWQSNIAHVPQSIFLADTTIEENIAFGVPRDKIDRLRVKEAAQMANISDVIDSLPAKYLTIVGERGVRLSGGQRQRLGIARALYKRAGVIIFDEATSALDDRTERSVMDAIESLSEDLTILIVAHRISTLKGCSKIVELGRHEIKRICSYEEIIN